jgi:hypothetical protein
MNASSSSLVMPSFVDAVKRLANNLDPVTSIWDPRMVEFENT